MLLKKLTDARGISGDEFEIRSLLKELAEARGASCTIDRMGNLIAVKDGQQSDAPALLLCAHMDEVGMIVTGIREDGMLRYAPVGDIDPRVMVSIPVLCGKNQIPGIIGAKAIHLQTPEDRKKVLDHDHLYIDVGAKTQKEAEQLVPVGSYVVFDSPLMEFGEGMLASRALDDRVGCLNLLAALEHGYAGKLICAFTVQEETGLRGAVTASRWLTYDLCISLDTTSANDLCTDENIGSVCELNHGVAISFMDGGTIVPPALRDALIQVAEDRKISWQHKRGTSEANDTASFQKRGGARPVASLSVPCRNIHSPNCVVSLNDIESQSALINAFMEELSTFWPDICSGC